MTLEKVPKNNTNRLSLFSFIHGMSFLRNKSTVKNVLNSLRTRLPLKTKKKRTWKPRINQETKQKTKNKIKQELKQEIEYTELKFKKKYEKVITKTSKSLEELALEIEIIKKTIKKLNNEEKKEQQKILRQKEREYFNLKFKTKKDLHKLNKKIISENEKEKNKTDNIPVWEDKLVSSLWKLKERSVVYKKISKLKWKEANSLLKVKSKLIWWDDFFFSEQFLNATDMLIAKYKKIGNVQRANEVTQLKQSIESYKSAFSSEKVEKYMELEKTMKQYSFT